jgi:hypothetical protein
MPSEEHGDLAGLQQALLDADGLAEARPEAEAGPWPRVRRQLAALGIRSCYALPLRSSTRHWA